MILDFIKKKKKRKMKRTVRQDQRIDSSVYFVAWRVCPFVAPLTERSSSRRRNGSFSIDGNRRGVKEV